MSCFFKKVAGNFTSSTSSFIQVIERSASGSVFHLTRIGEIDNISRRNISLEVQNNNPDNLEIVIFGEYIKPK